MKHRTESWTWRILALLLVASVILSACGGGGATATPAAAGQTETEAEPTAVAAEPTAEAEPTAAEAEATPAEGAEAEASPTVEAAAGETPTAEAETEPPAATGSDTGAAAADQPVLNPDVSGRVELWHFWASPVRRQAIRRVIAICQQQLPNIEVIDTVKPFGDIWTANLAAVAAGSGMPDVIVSDRPTLPGDASVVAAKAIGVV